MYRLSLQHPVVRTGRVRFSWTLEPDPGLYNASHFDMEYPSTIDLTRVPLRVWWMVQFICMHVHWALLRPLTVKIPIRLMPGEAEVWKRLVATYSSSMRSVDSGSGNGIELVIEEGDEELPEFSLHSDSLRCVAAFSAGKDSLTQAGLLRELTQNPILVTTTSSMHEGDSQTTRRRQEVLKRTSEMPEFTFVEMRSNLRGRWDNEFTLRTGCSGAMNEISDTFLYVAALVPVAIVLEAPHLFIASENEVSCNIDLHGRFVQHQHFMYSAVSLGGLNIILSRLGLHLSSLNYPLHSYQVQSLLSTRYSDLADLQYSCWRTRGDERACNRCMSCLRIGITALWAGGKPSAQGVELSKVLAENKKWRWRDLEYPAYQHPNRTVGNRLRGQLWAVVQNLSLWQMFRYLLRAEPRSLLRSVGWRALFYYAWHRRQASKIKPIGFPGYCRGYVGLIDPALRQDVDRIFSERFSPEPRSHYAQELNRTGDVLRHLAEPMI